MFISNRSKYKPLRKQLRKNQTDAERKVWNILRNKQIQSLKFFRQYGIGNYIVDFYCPSIKLIIEIDGGQHAENAAFDEQRTRYFQSLDIKLIRFWNNEVLENIEGVYEKIVETINSPLPSL